MKIDLRPGGLRGLEHVDGADDVHLGVELGALHRRLDVGLRGEVEDDVALDLERRADVVLEQTGCRVQVLALAGVEVVDDQHVVAPGDQSINEVRADEARTPCHDRPHLRLS